MEIARERRAGPKRIGELLVAANVIKPEVLLEALQVAKKSATPLGRVLMGIGELTERDLQTTIEIQSLLREGVISAEFGVRALNVAIKGCIPLEEAFTRLGWKAPQRESMPASELGELLLEAGAVTRENLAEAMTQSQENNLPLGRCLVLARAIPSSLLTSALTAQVLLRDGKITKDQAVSGMRAAAKKHQTIEVSLQEVGAFRPNNTNIRVGDLLMHAGLVTEGDKISAIEMGLVKQMPVGQVLVQAGTISEFMLQQALKLQEMVAKGNMTGTQAADVLKSASARNCVIETIIAERSTKEDEIARANAVVDILQSAGALTPQDVTKAEGVSKQLNVSLGEVLLSTGVIDKKLLQAAVQAQGFVDDDILSLSHATAVLHYVQKTGVEFSAALKEVAYTPTAETPDPALQQQSGWLGKLWSKVKKPGE